MFVVKIGGSRGINLDYVLEDLARQTEPVVLVHGASDELNRISEQLGKPPRMVTSPSGYTSRYTDRETLDIFAMVYCGKLNTRIVEKLQQFGVNAVGLSGVDGRLLEGRRKPSIRIVEEGKTKVLHDDFTGKVEKANAGLLRLLLDAGYLPVISPLAISHEREAINVDGDRAAAVIANALGADRLIILSNTPGFLKDVNDESSLVRELSREGIAQAIETYAQGRMKKKLLGAQEALDEGVKEVVLADGRTPGCITAALGGQGTVIKATKEG
ncbi:MAG: [LysW]-aminoadipate kinase [candidate division Zixibacteria bacterium]|nr:[LysW]-aminoadipate kinase [candidate division Zixibacteria bacterium]